MRTITTETKAYTWEELSESAKDYAREQYRNGNLDGYDWWDSVYDDTKAIGALFGLRIDRIYFSGFWSKGDGACFEGGYQYRKGALKAVVEYAPKDTELHGIVARLQEVQRKAFYGLYASCKQSGRYNSMRVNVDNDSRDISEDEEDNITDELRLFAGWIYSQLESEYEYLQSDECIDEYLANFEFTSEGEWI
jgi:hypothetical protein